MNATQDNGEREARLNEAIAAYYQAVEAGQTPVRDEFLARYPDLAGELASFLADKAQFERVAAPLPPTLGGPGPTDAELGKVRYFGDYELLEEIARGGMGVVFKARQVSLNRLVALKMILRGELASDADVRRFLQEAEAAANLDHPNIVPIYEVGEHDGRQYFSMKLIDGGGSLSSMSGAPRASAEQQRRVARLLATVARAVHYAHQRGILHRDLKPSNVLVDARGEPHVADFGLARRLEGSQGATQSGAIVGTPAYMPPEQATGRKDVSTAADVYSLGAVLYELLTGQPPFRGESPMEVLLQVVEREPQRPGAINPGLDRDLETICLKCLEKEPGRRYGSAEALAEDLERWLRGEPILVRPSGVGERALKWARRHPAVAAAYALLLVATLLGTVGGAVTWLWLRAEESRRQAEIARGLAEEARQEAEGERRQAEVARQDADTAREDAAQARDRLADAHARLQTETDLRQTADAKVIRVTQMARYISNLQLAQREWETFNIVRAEQILDGCPDDLRGWEWYHLKGCCRRRAFPFPGHNGTVHSAVFSPDGKRLASVGADATVKVWNAQTGQAILTLKSPTSHISNVCFSPDGKRLASADGKVWDAASGKELLAFQGQKGFVNSVCFSPDGKHLASGSKVWDAQTGQEILSLVAPGHVSSACFSPDGRRLAATGNGEADDALRTLTRHYGWVKVWDVASGQELLSLQGTDRAYTFRSACFSPDGKRLACANSKTMKVWEAAGGQELLALEAHTGDGHVSSVCFSPDGKLLASAAFDRTVRLWDAQTGRQQLTLLGHTSSVTSAYFSPDGKRLVSAGSDGTMRVWELAGGQEQLTLQGHTSDVTHVCFSPDGNRLASAGSDQTVRVWDLAGQELLTYKGHAALASRVTSVCFSPDGKRLASASEAGVHVWDAAGGQRVHSLQGHPLRPNGFGSVCFSPDGRRLAAWSWDDHTVKVWDAAGGQEQLSIQPDGYLTGVCFSPDGKRLASVSWKRIGATSTVVHGEVKLWDAANGQELLSFQAHNATITHVCFSPDGKRLATASVDQTVKVWDATSGRQQLTLQGHTSDVNSVCFSPDSKRLVSASTDRTVKVWDTAGGLELLALQGHTSNVTSICFSPDGKRLASAGSDKTVKLWDATDLPEKPGPKEAIPNK